MCAMFYVAPAAGVFLLILLGLTCLYTYLVRTTRQKHRQPFPADVAAMSSHSVFSRALLRVAGSQPHPFRGGPPRRRVSLVPRLVK